MITYAIMYFNDDEKEETPLAGCKTNHDARIKAKMYASEYGIRAYKIYRDSDDCRVEIDQ